jgi:hypothetical protein
MFQSSPTSKGGRYILSLPSRTHRSRFQSSPTSKGGRYLRSLLNVDLGIEFQSSPTVKTEVDCPQITDLRCPLFTDEIVHSVWSG